MTIFRGFSQDVSQGAIMIRNLCGSLIALSVQWLQE